MIYRQIHKNCSQRRIPSLNGAQKRGSASKIHQHAVLQKGAGLQNSSTYRPPKGVRLQNLSAKGGLPLDFINQKGVRLQISSTKKGSHQPKRDNFYGSSGTTSVGMVMLLEVAQSFSMKRLIFSKLEARQENDWLIRLHCQFSQQACTNFMQTYLYSLISTHFFILTTNLHCKICNLKMPLTYIDYVINKPNLLRTQNFRCI